MVKTKLIVVVLCITLFSCLKDEVVPLLVDDGTVMFVCEDAQPATKTTLNALQTEWVANTDKVGIFSPQASITIGGNPGVVNEPLTALSNGARSQFSGAVYWNTGDHVFYSYYPYAVGTPPHTAVPVSLPANQTQSFGNNSAHLGALDFLVAKPHTAKYPGASGAPATVSLRYNHLFSIIEFQIIRSSGSGTITKVQLRGRVPLAFESGTVNLTQNAPTSGVSYIIDGVANVSNSVTVSLTSAMTPTNSYETTPKVYMVVLPGTHIGEVKIALESGGIFREVKKTDITFERGKKYVMRVDAANATITLIKGSELEPVTVGSVIWAPLNVGYREDLAAGELFQWHRKYGFDNDYSIMSASSTLDLDQETALDKYKKVYFKSGGSAYEWMPVYNSEWNLTEKFNPCPTGWRLPTKAEATALIAYGSTSIPNENTGGVDGLKGRWIGPNHDNSDLRTSTAVFFPAGGMISYSNGTWPTIFNSGTYWLAFYGEPSNTYNGQVMNISSTQTTTPSASLGNKANGYSVRCVKKGNVTEALLVTVKPYGYKHDGATTGGFIENQGDLPITERGVFYGLSVNPTSLNVVAPTAGVGDFSVILSRLEPNRVYFVRAYAKNSAGTTYYGDQYKFTTLASHVADYGGQEVTINGVTWAPWNAGYVEGTHTYGYLYQWHRKYGQGYNSTESPVFSTLNSAGTKAAASSYVNRDKFYKILSSPYDCITPQLDFWDMDQLYNPCPVGWRVPTGAELQSLVDAGSTWASGPNSQTGRWFGGNHATDRAGSVFFPASGYRTYDSDAVHKTAGRGTDGLYWTSEKNITFTTNASLLYFTNSTIYVGRIEKAVGSSVRCVKN